MERSDSNSARLVSLALAGDLDAVVDEQVISEVSRFVRRTLTRSHAWLYGEQIRRNTTVMSRSQCEREFARLKGFLKPADRLHLAAMRASGAKLLIAYDSDFAGLPEYLTPKQAIKRLGLRPARSEW